MEFTSNAAAPEIVEAVSHVRNRFGRAGLVALMGLAQQELTGAPTEQGFRVFDTQYPSYVGP